MYHLQTQSLDRKLFYWFSFPLIIIAVSDVKNLNDKNRAGGAYESSICNVYSLQLIVDVLYFSPWCRLANCNIRDHSYMIMPPSNLHGYVDWQFQ